MRKYGEYESLDHLLFLSCLNVHFDSSFDVVRAISVPTETISPVKEGGEDTAGHGNKGQDVEGVGHQEGGRRIQTIKSFTVKVISQLRN